MLLGLVKFTGKICAPFGNHCIKKIWHTNYAAASHKNTHMYITHSLNPELSNINDRMRTKSLKYEICNTKIQ